MDEASLGNPRHTSLCLLTVLVPFAGIVSVPQHLSHVLWYSGTDSEVSASL